MIARLQDDFTPRTIADSRNLRSTCLGGLIRVGLRRIRRRFTAWRTRIALARQYQREMAVLLQADDRMLMDIGITRADARAAAGEGSWSNPGGLLGALATRRKEAMTAAHDRGSPLPRVDAPALAPQGRMRAIETENFR